MYVLVYVANNGNNNLVKVSRSIDALRDYVEKHSPDGEWQSLFCINRYHENTGDYYCDGTWIIERIDEI